MKYVHKSNGTNDSRSVTKRWDCTTSTSVELVYLPLCRRHDTVVEVYIQFGWGKAFSVCLFVFTIYIQVTVRSDSQHKKPRSRMNLDRHSVQPVLFPPHRIKLIMHVDECSTIDVPFTWRLGTLVAARYTLGEESLN